MKFKIGDKVAVLDDIVKGWVRAINLTKITVEDEDGFSYDYNEAELVLIEENQAELSKYIDISNSDLMEKLKEKKSNKGTPKFKSVLKPSKVPPMEVDLHIHQLTSTTRGMDNYAMLNLQLETAKHKLEFAIKNNMQKVIFIHGVGDGVLKSELEFLLKNYNVDYYEASFQKYGLGATEVHIFQNPRN